MTHGNVASSRFQNTAITPHWLRLIRGGMTTICLDTLTMLNSIGALKLFRLENLAKTEMMPLVRPYLPYLQISNDSIFVLVLT